MLFLKPIPLCAHIFIEQKKVLWYNMCDNRVAGWYGLHTRRWCRWNNSISKTLWPLVCLSLHCWPSCVCCVNNYFSKRKSTPKLWPVNGWSFFHICRPTHLVGGCPFSFLVYHYSLFCATTKLSLLLLYNIILHSKTVANVTLKHVTKHKKGPLNRLLINLLHIKRPL